MKNILCVGGSGQLGRHVLNQLAKHRLVNIDFTPHEKAQHNVLLEGGSSSGSNNKLALNAVHQLGLKYHAILVTAGGWTGGSIKDDDYFEKLRKMQEVNLYPSVLAAHIATKLLEPKGLVVFTGASSVYKEPQPDMLAYSLAKAGVHSLATILAEKAQNNNTVNGRVVTILPETIDTASNREGMPTADFSKWAKPEHIAELLQSWVEGLNVPANGSFVALKVAHGCISPQFV